MGRKLAISQRTDLSFFKGWEGCYIEWVPATYAQARKLRSYDFANISDEEDTKIAIEIVKERMTGGKVRIAGDSGDPKIVGIERDDIDLLPGEMIDRVLADMTGVQYDPDPLEQTPAASVSSTDTSSTERQTPTNSLEKQ